MADNDLFDELDSNTTSAGFSSGDYADWWEPDEDDGEELVGVIVEKHSAPEDWTDVGEVPDTVHTVLSIGRGDVEAGQLRTPKQHKQLKNALESVEIGDLVNLKFTGYEKVDGNVMNNYEVGVLAEEEWQELDGADDVQVVIDDHKANDGIWGDNTRSEPYTSVGGSTSTDDSDDTNPEDNAVAYLEQLVDTQGGSIDVDKADKMLNDINDHDTDPEEAAVLAGFEVNDGVIEE